MRERMKIFGLGDCKAYANEVCKCLSQNLSKHEETYFDDGECFVCSEENVRGSDVFVICSLYNSKTERLADKVVKLLYFAASLKDASASRVTLVIPYMAYQRQDRKNKSRAPVYTKYFPQIIESVLKSNDRILTVDPHNLAAFQSGTRMVNDHLEAKNPICVWLEKQLKIDGIDLNSVVILSPDEGGVKRARKYRDKLSILLGLKSSLEIAYIDKTHTNDGTIHANKIIGNVKDKLIIVFDDMISSGKTMIEAMDACKVAGGKLYAVCATHALCVGKAEEYIKTLLDNQVNVVVTDTVHPLSLSQETYSRLQIITTVQLVAEGIRCTHNEESISSLLV